LNKNFFQNTGNRRRNFSVDFVSGNLNEGLVYCDWVTNFFEPPGDGAFGDALAQRGEIDFLTHESDSF
jgi:hypothetical protein